jgi:Holliday junction resolvase RusA-like endonuclease
MTELIPSSALWPNQDHWKDPDHDEFAFYVQVSGPPAAMPRPTSMAWLKDGQLKKRVFNGKGKQIKEFREQCKNQLTAQGATVFPVHPSNPVTVDIIFYRKVPKANHSKVRTARGTKMTQWDCKKPDLDNLAKFVMDALTGVFYSDDEQVVRLSSIKQMDTQEPMEGRTTIKLSIAPL